jgi:hypothetical protein
MIARMDEKKLIKRHASGSPSAHCTSFFDHQSTKSKKDDGVRYMPKTITFQSSRTKL